MILLLTSNWHKGKNKTISAALASSVILKKTCAWAQKRTCKYQELPPCRCHPRVKPPSHSLFKYKKKMFAYKLHLHSSKLRINILDDTVNRRYWQWITLEGFTNRRHMRYVISGSSGHALIKSASTINGLSLHSNTQMTGTLKDTNYNTFFSLTSTHTGPVGYQDSSWPASVRAEHIGLTWMFSYQCRFCSWHFAWVDPYRARYNC